MGDRDAVTLNGDVPKWLKLVMLFIDRVGFPALAFVLMFYISFVSMEKLTVALMANSRVLMEFKESSKGFETLVAKDHNKMLCDIEEIKKYSYGYQDYLKATRMR